MCKKPLHYIEHRKERQIVLVRISLSMERTITMNKMNTLLHQKHNNLSCAFWAKREEVKNNG